ncbi:MAG: DUF1294 domain-containing protein [Ruminococcaceae bacterium]|nr:DUF1294 domain-containing protein [Oscillospiraceae bacterium]
MKYLLIFYAVMSAVALIAYTVDKIKAKRRAWRVPEATLLGMGFLGGSVGALLGMFLIRHKTKHWYFWTVNFLGLAWQAAAAYFLYTK